MQNQKEIIVNGQTTFVRKIPLGKYPAIIESVKGLTKHKELFADLSNESIMQSLPQLLIVATPDVINVIHTVSDISQDEIEQWGLDDFVLYIETLFEINNFNYVYNTIKKATAQMKTPQQVGGGNQAAQ